jgi:hypothetical protein
MFLKNPVAHRFPLIESRRLPSSKHYLGIGILLLATLIAHQDCHGQLFGNRRVGVPLGRRPRPQAQTPESMEEGLLLGTERFLRENRAATEFVGSDKNEVSKFVGQVNAGEQTMNVAPAIDPLNRPDLSNLINRPARMRRPNGPLDPPLVLGFQLEPETIARHVAKAQKSIGHSLSVRFESQIEVLVEGQTAILRGEVRDAEQSRLAEIIAQLEPGIASVRNELIFDQQPPVANR